MTIEKQHIHFNTLILAGGKSSRMNFPKLWLPFDENQNFLQKIVSSYHKFGSNKIVVVINEAYINGYDEFVSTLPDYVTVIANTCPEFGRMYSLKLAIPHLKSSLKTIIHNVDNPFVSEFVIKQLLDTDCSDCVKPKIGSKNGHPIVISRRILESILSSPNSIQLREILHKCSCTEVTVNDSSILFNINSPEEYERTFQRKVPIIN